MSCIGNLFDKQYNIHGKAVMSWYLLHQHKMQTKHRGRGRKMLRTGHFVYMDHPKSVGKAHLDTVEFAYIAKKQSIKMVVKQELGINWS